MGRCKRPDLKHARLLMGWNVTHAWNAGHPGIAGAIAPFRDLHAACRREQGHSFKPPHAANQSAGNSASKDRADFH